MRFFTIGVNELEKYARKPNTILIDLRTKSEYEQYHIEGAKNIPYDELIETMGKLSKKITYILYCERGGSSLMAAKDLSRKGYEIYTVIGGIHAWNERMKKEYQSKNIDSKRGKL